MQKRLASDCACDAGSSSSALKVGQGKAFDPRAEAFVPQQVPQVASDSTWAGELFGEFSDTSGLWEHHMGAEMMSQAYAAPQDAGYGERATAPILTLEVPSPTPDEGGLLADWTDDQSGYISLDELLNGYDKWPEFQEQMRLMDVEREDMKSLFSMLDKDGSGFIAYTEFEEQVVKMGSQDTTFRFLRSQMKDLKHCLTDVSLAFQKTASDMEHERINLMYVITQVNQNFEHLSREMAQLSHHVTRTQQDLIHLQQEVAQRCVDDATGFAHQLAHFRKEVGTYLEQLSHMAHGSEEPGPEVRRRRAKMETVGTQTDQDNAPLQSETEETHEVAVKGHSANAEDDTARAAASMAVAQCLQNAEDDTARAAASLAVAQWQKAEGAETINSEEGVGDVGGVSQNTSSSSTIPLNGRRVGGPPPQRRILPEGVDGLRLIQPPAKAPPGGMGAIPPEVFEEKEIVPVPIQRMPPVKAAPPPETPAAEAAEAPAATPQVHAETPAETPAAEAKRPDVGRPLGFLHANPGSASDQWRKTKELGE